MTVAGSCEHSAVSMGSLKVWEISLLAERPSASHKGFCYAELVQMMSYGLAGPSSVSGKEV
jgi:hypothetical protein